MAIGMSEAMMSLGRPVRTYVPPEVVPHAPVLKAQCRCCSFEPEDPFVLPARCPKCHGAAWERFARPGACADFAAGTMAEDEEGDGAEA